jgi:hypothetical protein
VPGIHSKLAQPGFVDISHLILHIHTAIYTLPYIHCIYTLHIYTAYTNCIYTAYIHCIYMGFIVGNYMHSIKTTPRMQIYIATPRMQNIHCIYTGFTVKEFEGKIGICTRFI